jgi:amino acid transporter
MSLMRRLFAIKSLEMLEKEAHSENRLRRCLGPIGLTSLGVGAIIGAGIFVMTGEMAANAAGPGVLLSFLVAGFACALAAFCYAEFASMAPVAGSAYTYAYATLGELIAWIIGWDLILEYAMSAAVVAASWSQYLNKLLEICGVPTIPKFLCSDPFSTPGAWFNLPAVLVLLFCTIVLVIGIRESAASNTVMVLVKLGVVLFVIVVGAFFVNPANWTSVPIEARVLPEQLLLPDIANDYAKEEAANRIKTSRPDQLKETEDAEERGALLTKQSIALLRLRHAEATKDADVIAFVRAGCEKDLPTTPEDIATAEALIKKSQTPELRRQAAAKNWGLLAELGINERLESLDNYTRTRFTPYGISGIIFAASIVFFAFIGFDSISTHSEEAINPQRDLPFGIIASLVLCSVLYVGVSSIITGMIPYPEIDTEAAVASAFSDAAKKVDNPLLLNASAALIAIGGLAGMTSVLLITFLSQARIFLAMARDGLLPNAIFGKVHPRFRTPHISTIFTGVIMMVITAFTPIKALEEMVNIGTLFAFVVVCGAVLLLRIRRPEAPRPFRCPAIYIVGPLGILINLLLMLFLPITTWIRLVVWLVIGLVFYFCFGYWHSVMSASPPSAGPSSPHDEHIRVGL